MLLVKWLLQDSPQADDRPLSQLDLDWCLTQCWNLAKQAQQLDLSKHACVLYELAGIIVSSMPETSTDQLRRGMTGFVCAAGHGIDATESVRSAAVFAPLQLPASHSLRCSGLRSHHLHTTAACKRTTLTH